MKNTAKSLKLQNLKKELEELEKQEIELNGRAKRSYEALKMFALIVLLMCAIFQTCYIKDSLDLSSGAFGVGFDNEINEDDVKDDEDGPYELDNGENNVPENNIHHNNDFNTNSNIINNSNSINNTISTNENYKNEITNGNNGENSNTTIDGDIDYDDKNEDEEIKTEPVTIEEIKDIKLIQASNNDGTSTEKTEFSKLDNLEIFKSSEYFSEKLIYPGINGEYKFYIENYTTKNIEYKLTFNVENDKNTNIRYKLKRNGNYIVGNENTYVSYTNLTQQSMKLRSKMGDIYTLEWKWIEYENDSETTDAITRGMYKLTIKGEVV